MPGTVRTWARSIAVGLALQCAACGGDKPAPPPVDPLLGAWCQQSQSASADGPRVLAGSKWELRADGTYSYAFKWNRWDERWSRSGDALSFGKLGAHQIVQLRQDAMILSQGALHRYFGRDCGPEYAKADLVHQLVGAAESAAPNKVEQLLKAGASIDGIDTFGVLEQTALIAAVRAHDLPMVKLLLGRGARHDIETKAGVTAMNAAELAGYLDIVEELLKAGARPSTRPPAPRALTAEELESARVQKLLDLDPGALIEDHGPPKPPAPITVPGFPVGGPAPAPAAAAAPAESAEAAKPAPAPAPQPKPKPEDKELDAMKKQLCSSRPPTLDAPPSAELAEMLKAIGMTAEEYSAQQKAIYEQTCK